MTVIWIEVLVILVLILLNGFLSMSEIAIVSARKVRLIQMAEAGQAGAHTALELAQQPGRFLSTVQIGITLVGILTGVFGGATVSEELAQLLSHSSILAPYSQSIGVTLVVILITFLSLLLGELVPKQIALNSIEPIAATVAPVMLRLSRLTAPVVHLLTHSSTFILRLLKIQPSSEPFFTEDDIRGLIEQGVEDGIFEPVEEEMLQQVIRLGDRHASELMTPRPDVIYLDIQDPLEENFVRISDSGFSHFPLVDGGLDNVLGLVRSKDLLLQYMNNGSPDLSAAMQTALFVPERALAIQVLEQFRQTHTHMACVIDEYGNVEGVLTPTDIMEAIVGDMPELDQDPDAVQRPDGSWLLSGRLPLDEIKDILDIKHLPREEENAYQTLGGLIMTHLSRIPETGDSFEWQNWLFEVVDMDGHRVDKVLVRDVIP